MATKGATSFESTATVLPTSAVDPSSGVSRREGAPDDSPTPIPEVGTILDGKFRIDGILGKGGMAVVLAATHLQLDQRVAIKLLLPSRADDPEVVARFLQEGRSASKIRSEHVVRVLDVGVDDERPYLVMEYLDGTDLDVLLAQGGPLATELAVDYLLQACEAIAEAHVGGIVHRDLKPANLFLTHRADGAACVKVLDFGISKILQSPSSVTVAHETSPLLIMGSPHYMSPEQMKSSRSVDQRSDLWSLGAILHELVAGTPPFQGQSITALCAAILTEPPPPLTSRHGEVPSALASVVQRCLEKDPARRFANVAELAAALAPLGSEAAYVSATCIERVLGGGSIPDIAERASAARPALPTAAETLGGEAPRSGVRGRHVAVLATLLAVCAGIGWLVVERDRAATDVAARSRATVVVAAPPAPAPAAPPSVVAPAVVAPVAAAPHAMTPRHPRAPRAPAPVAAPTATAASPAEGTADNPY